MTTQTERPEERDWLAEIEKRWFDPLTPTPNVLGAAQLDLRTLINEVKERDEEAAELRENWHRAAAVGDTALKRINALEAEVKELRESLEHERRVVDSRNLELLALTAQSQQMEEALREIARHGPECDGECALDMLGIARAALSPSDTEEEA
jgi:hypothetical protein